MDLAKLKYSASHEWALLEGTTVTVGVTKFAVDQLTDVTYLELPKVGKAYAKGAEFGVIESVKSTSSLYSPVEGTVVEVNEAAAKDTAIVNEDPYTKGWIAKFSVAPGTNLDHLLSQAQYEAQLAGH
jgi:glycine cleavage system H protein